MKSLRYILTVAVSVIALEASAWTGVVNKAILMFAEENLSKGAKREVVEILGAPLQSIEFEKKGTNKTRLNASGKSVTTDEKDAVVRLERAIAVLGNKAASAAERKAALIEVAELTVDIHCPSNILIDGHLEKDFTFLRDNGRPKNSRWFRAVPIKWRAMWHKNYHTSHLSFSEEMYLYDWRIATKGMAKQYKKAAVEPRKWAEHTAERVLHSLKTFQPDATVNMLEITKQEEVNNAAMYDAAFRLAALLNQTIY